MKNSNNKVITNDSKNQNLVANKNTIEREISDAFGAEYKTTNGPDYFLSFWIFLVAWLVNAYTRAAVVKNPEPAFAWLNPTNSGYQVSFFLGLSLAYITLTALLTVRNDIRRLGFALPDAISNVMRLYVGGISAVLLIGHADSLPIFETHIKTISSIMLLAVLVVQLGMEHTIGKAYGKTDPLYPECTSRYATARNISMGMAAVVISVTGITFFFAAEEGLLSFCINMGIAATEFFLLLKLHKTLGNSMQPAVRS